MSGPLDVDFGVLNPGLAARIPNDGFDRVAVGGFHGTFKVDDDPAARRGFGDRDDRVVAFECSGLSLSHDVPHECRAWQSKVLGMRAIY